MANAFFSDLLSTISERGRSLLRRGEPDDGKERRLRPDRIVRGAAVGPRRSLRHRDGARGARPLPRARRARAGVAFFETLARDYGPDRERLAQGDRGLAGAARRRQRQRVHFASEPRRQELIRRLNRAPGGTSDLVAMRADLLDAHEWPQGSRRARPRRRASARLVVQQGISRAAQDRLVDAGEHSRTDHPLRSRARNPRLGRSAPPHRSGRPPLLRLLPSGAAGCAADLRRGGADRDDSERDRAAACRSTASRCRSIARAPRCSTRSPTPSAGSAASPSATS